MAINHPKPHVEYDPMATTHGPVRLTSIEADATIIDDQLKRGKCGRCISQRSKVCRRKRHWVFHCSMLVVDPLTVPVVEAQVLALSPHSCFQ